MIRLATLEDLDTIMEIYNHARNYMIETGNPTQWNDYYPSREIIMEDMEQNQLYVYEEFDEIHGVFAFIIGEDETYKVIEDGKWLSDELYGTIHRIASDGKVKGVFQNILNFCSEIISHIRIDTHQNNKIMRHLITKNGFKRCGNVYVGDGTTRMAFEKVENI